MIVTLQNIYITIWFFRRLGVSGYNISTERSEQGTVILYKHYHMQ